jgi:hypothetical protein
LGVSSGCHEEESGSDDRRLSINATGTVTVTVEDAAQNLESSFRTLEWALAMLPTEWQRRAPTGVIAGFGDDAWSVALNLAHLVIYDERIGLPVLQSLASGGDGTHPNFTTPRESQFLRDWEELSSAPIDGIMDRFRAARERQVTLIRTFSDAEFNRPVTSLWGRYKAYGGPLHSVGWVASKTFQHTWEHGNAILRIALFCPR